MKLANYFRKPKILAIAIGLVLIAVGGVVIATRKPNAEIVAPPSKKPKKAVNLIPMDERPYVTLKPLSGRNLLEVKIYELPKEAKSVEVSLEYDRNKGVQDAVLNSFNLTAFPLVEEMFLGSKSAGGHTTYHEDVIGGTMTLDFTDDDYALAVPWRYVDTQKSYDKLSTTDGKFQAALDKPIKDNKVLIMQSPGVPGKVKGSVNSGVYYIGSVGDLPDTTAEIKIRLDEESANATIMGWDGTDWIQYNTSVDGKTASAKGNLVSTYVVVK